MSAAVFGLPLFIMENDFGMCKLHKIMVHL